VSEHGVDNETDGAVDIAREGNKRLIDSFDNAWQGIGYTFVHERNFKIHIAAAVLACAVGVLLRVTPTEFLIVLFAVFLVLCLELINTAIETLTDLYCGDTKNELAKIAKDTAAAAVLLASMLAVAVGAAIFAPAAIQLWIN